MHIANVSRLAYDRTWADVSVAYNTPIGTRVPRLPLHFVAYCDELQEASRQMNRK